MTSPVNQRTGRDRANVFTGAPDVSVSGGFFIGKPVLDPSLFPKNATESAAEVAERAGLTTAGYISNEGVTETENRSTEAIRDWNNDVIEYVESEYGIQLTTTFAEAANADVLKAIYGAENVEVTEGSVHVRKGSRPTETVGLMFDIKGKGGRRGRAFAAEATVSTVGEISYIKNGLIQYNVTIDVLNDATGAYLHTWFDTSGDGAAASSPAESGPGAEDAPGA